MLDWFPYGKAPLVILLTALVSGAVIAALGLRRAAEKPDLVFAIYAKNHEEAYRAVLPEFEKRHGVKVSLQLVDSRALQSRLQSALQTGAAVPDLVEILEGAMGYFTRGPLADVGLLDLTPRLHAEGLYDKMVETRYSLWSSRGHVFALPHDVHPVALAYRRDLVEQLGIDVAALRTWDDFAAMGRRITKDLDGDGVPDRYAIDLPVTGDDGLRMLALQRGGGLFDAEGRLVMDSDRMAETIVWYVRQTVGPDRISTSTGFGQSQVRAMTDGLVLFYLCPDWRTKQFEMDAPHLAGKMALMPLPGWTTNGCRTSTWGGTGLAITKPCKRPDLAWELAKFLYLDAAELGTRFRGMNILPPLKDAWSDEAFAEPRPYFSGQAIGRLYAGLALQAPPSHTSPYSRLAQSKFAETYLAAAARFRASGDEGLPAFTRAELAKNAAYVRRIMDRNVFLKADAGQEGN